MADDPREGQICPKCGLDATLAPTIAPNGFRHEHHHPFKDGCLVALIAEVKNLRAEIDYLRDLVESPTEQKVVVCQMTGIEHRV